MSRKSKPYSPSSRNYRRAKTTQNSNLYEDQRQKNNYQHQHHPFWKKKSNKIITYHMPGSRADSEAYSQVNASRGAAYSKQNSIHGFDSETVFDQIAIAERTRNGGKKTRARQWAAERTPKKSKKKYRSQREQPHLGGENPQNFTFTPEKEDYMQAEGMAAEGGFAGGEAPQSREEGKGGYLMKLKSPRTQQEVADKMVQIFRDLGVNGK